jgi:LPXTG-motif cell wall-anchored protein
MLASTQMWMLIFGIAAVVVLGIIIAMRARKRKGG